MSSIREKSKSSVKSCICEHEYQDSIYGKGKRLHNWAVKSEKWRCSVCGRDRA